MLQYAIAAVEQGISELPGKARSVHVVDGASCWADCVADAGSRTADVGEVGRYGHRNYRIIQTGIVAQCQRAGTVGQADLAATGERVLYDVEGS